MICYISIVFALYIIQALYRIRMICFYIGKADLCLISMCLVWWEPGTLPSRGVTGTGRRFARWTTNQSSCLDIITMVPKRTSAVTINRIDILRFRISSSHDDHFIVMINHMFFVRTVSKDSAFKSIVVLVLWLIKFVWLNRFLLFLAVFSDFLWTV